MRRIIVGVLLSVAIVLGSAWAETYAEKIKSVDATAKTVTFVVAATGKEKTLKVQEGAKVRQQQKVGKRVMLVDIKDGLKGLKKDDPVIITTKAIDGEELVSEILLETVSAGKPKKGKVNDE